MKYFLLFMAVAVNVKTEVIFGIFGEMFLAVIVFAILGIIIFAVRKNKINSVKRKLKSDYGVSFPSDTKLEFRSCGIIERSYGKKINYYVFKFKKEPAGVIGNFTSLHLKEDITAEELKDELKKYFNIVIIGLGAIYKEIPEQYFPKWDGAMIWNNGEFPAVYYPDKKEMIVCVSEKE